MPLVALPVEVRAHQGVLEQILRFLPVLHNVRQKRCSRGMSVSTSASKEARTLPATPPPPRTLPAVASIHLATCLPSFCSSGVPAFRAPRGPRLFMIASFKTE